MSNVIPVHQLRAAQRWLLVELLTQEGDGEDALHLSTLDRTSADAPPEDDIDVDAPWFMQHRMEVARELCQLGLCRWLAVDLVGFTPLGRSVAEAVAQKLIYGTFARAS